MTPQHHQHHYHRHRHHHRMEIVLENLSVAPLQVRTPASPSAATSQLGLPMHPPPPPPPPPPSSSSSSSSSSHHFAHRKMLYDVDAPLLPADDYYARHELASYDRDLDGASELMTVRRVGKSGLLETAETEAAMCQRSRASFAGAEDIAARTAVSLRLDRAGFLEAVPEAVDQLEEEGNAGVSDEHDAAATMTSAFDVEESERATPRGEGFQVDTDVNPRVFDGACRPLEQPSSLEGLARPDEGSVRGHPVDLQVSGGSPRMQFDGSAKATERLPHLSSFSPGPSLRRPRNDSSRGSSLLPSRCTDTDSFAVRLRRSPEFTAKYANPTAMNLLGPLTSSSSLGTTTGSPIMRGQPQMRRSKENLEHPAAPLDSTVDVTADPIKASRDSLLAKGSTEQEDDDALPGEERAEAEGCEHTTVEGLEADEVSFKGSNKLLDNDNVQTLRVIILSEQL